MHSGPERPYAAALGHLVLLFGLGGRDFRPSQGIAPSPGKDPRKPGLIGAAKLEVPRPQFTGAELAGKITQNQSISRLGAMAHASPTTPTTAAC